MSSIKITYPEVAAQWHPTKNTISVDEATAGSNKKVWWLCSETCSEGCKHEWEAIVSSRCNYRKVGCPYCVNKKICIHESIVTTHPKISAEWHTAKNTNKLYDISEGSGRKVWWLCPNTCSGGCKHEWEATVASRCRAGHNCPHCASKIICIHTSIITTHPNIANQWHPTKNTISIEFVTAGSKKKAWWLCTKTCSQGCSHEWEASIGDRCVGYGCPVCSGRICCIHNSIVTTHPVVASQWHPTKNKEYCIDKLSKGSVKKVWWICEKGHEWKASINSRCHYRGGTGCPTCKHKTAQKLFEYIKTIFPDAINEYKADWCKNQITNKHLPFDIFIPSIKVIIELDGAQHFRQVSNWGDTNHTQLKDIYKMHMARKNGINIIRLLQEDVLNESLTWLDEHLKPLLVKTDDEACVWFIGDVYETHNNMYEDISEEKCIELLREYYEKYIDSEEELSDEDRSCITSELCSHEDEEEDHSASLINILYNPDLCTDELENEIVEAKKK
jgi:very-short-patch-repair endonuclease